LEKFGIEPPEDESKEKQDYVSELERLADQHNPGIITEILKQRRSLFLASVSVAGVLASCATDGRSPSTSIFCFVF